METKIGEIITINGVSYRIEIAPDESPCEGWRDDEIGRHPGLKHLWPLRLCGFKSRSRY